MIPLLTRPPQLPFPIRGLQGIWFLGRNNLLLDPRDFSSANWTKTDVTVATDSIAGPDGTANADTLTATGAGGTCVQSFTGAASTQYAHGVWLKRKTGTGDISLQWKAGTSDVVAVDGTWQLFSPSPYTVAGAPEGLTPGVLIATSGDAVYAVAAQLNKGATLFPFEDRGAQQTIAAYRGTAGTLQRGATTGAESTDPGITNSGLTFVTDDYVLSGNLANVTMAGDWTVYLVGLFNGTSGTVFCLGSSVNNMQYVSQSTTNLVVNSKDGTGFGTNSGYLAVPNNAVVVVAITHDGTTLRAKRMDTAVSVDTTSKDPTGTPLLALGATVGATGPVSAMTGHALGLANVVHNAAERARMYAWLKSELAKPPYGLAVL